MALKLPTLSLTLAKKTSQPTKRSAQKPEIHDASESALDDFVQTTIITDSANTSGPVTLQANTVSAIETSAGGSAIRSGAKQKFKLPIIGNQTLEQQSRALLILISAFAVISFFLMWMDNRLTSDRTKNAHRVSEATLHSQRLAKEVPSAIAGRPEAFLRIRESTSLVDQNISLLKGISEGATASSGTMIPAELYPLLVKVESSWARLKSDSSTVLSSENLLLKVNLGRDQFMLANQGVTKALESMGDARMSRNARGSEVGGFKQLILISQRLSGHVLALTSGGTVDANAELQIVAERKAFTQLLGALVEGAEPFAVRGPELGEAFSKLIRAEEQKAAALDSLLNSSKGVLLANGAAQSSLEQAEEMLTELNALAAASQGQGSANNWLTYLAALFGMLALLAGLALSKAYVDDSRIKANEAEEQRAESERLEQDAKRSNDQNQAAILRLMNELQEVADGDLTVQVTVSEDITGAIADSVNYTVEELRSLVARINSTAGRVSDASSKAQQISTGLLAASEQQSREIRETGESVLRLADSIHRVSSNALESAKVARHSLNAAERGADAVHRTISGMSDIREQIQDTAKRIKRLGESSQEVGEIVELISDITEQTNVLALNAAIQAASAGEAGRGFTVVAEEVQRLAERSAEATKQISALIKTIQSDTQDAVSAMERSTQNVVEGAKLSDAAGQALGEIGTVSRQLAELIESISVTTNREAASAGTVAQSIQRILLVTEQTSEGTQQTAGSVGQLTELAHDLKNSVTRFKVA
jgi:twitching motility protein PilJ